ncbi:NupC/NupG family nucleoside CNT transporter [Bacillus fonticola]|uniref:NupC/NupG family nucleoside CNT transporter n=1 Tax=Bacillus fonticola TaxID=2728853 RepID=UPI0014753361|nr:NupC/NupG family nucleoside CNT transporter [Bacillus fonticola]
MNFIWGLAGIFVILFIGFLLSSKRTAIKPRTILIGLAIQILIGFVALEFEPGIRAMEVVVNVANDVLASANEGLVFLFGGILPEQGVIFAFQVLPIVIFFSALISVLYYLKIMQTLVRFVGGALSKLLGTRKAESMSAAANIFVGQTEAPLVVRPYIHRMTESELFAVMVGGLASVAGSTLFGYASLGIDLNYLLPASFMAAPAGLVMAKLFLPETDQREEPKDFQMDADKESSNVVDAAARGASVGLELALNIGAMLLAFIGLIALINLLFSYVGGVFGFEELSLQLILGYIFSPIAFVIGVPWNEAVQAGNFIGQKLVLNEFVAYANFAPQMESFTEKTQAIITFALCGFANISSLAIILGGLGRLAPDRRNDLARLGVRAIIAGSLASLVSAAIAGMFI